MLAELNRDANQAIQSLNENRKNLLEFANLEKEYINNADVYAPSGTDFKVAKSKHMAMKNHAAKIQKEYKDNEAALTKRQERFAAVQAKKELASLYYAMAFGYGQ